MVEAAGIEPATMIVDDFIKYHLRPWKTTPTLVYLFLWKMRLIVFHGLILSTNGADLVPLE